MKAYLVIFVLLISSQNMVAQCLDSLQSPNTQAPCFSDFMPVCGCDGITYRNSCYADHATVLQYNEGPCEHLALDVYPNPATFWVNLTVVTKFESDVNLYIFDRNGNIFYYQYLTNVTNHSMIVPLSGFERGLYIIMAESNGEIQLSKLIRWEQ